MTSQPNTYTASLALLITWLFMECLMQRGHWKCCGGPQFELRSSHGNFLMKIGYLKTVLHGSKTQETDINHYSSSMMKTRNSIRSVKVQLITHATKSWQTRCCTLKFGFFFSCGSCLMSFWIELRSSHGIAAIYTTTAEAAVSSVNFLFLWWQYKSSNFSALISV